MLAKWSNEKKLELKNGKGKSKGEKFEVHIGEKNVNLNDRINFKLWIKGDSLEVPNRKVDKTQYFKDLQNLVSPY